MNHEPGGRKKPQALPTLPDYNKKTTRKWKTENYALR